MAFFIKFGQQWKNILTLHIKFIRVWKRPSWLVETFEIFDKRFGDLGIGSVIGKSGLNERDALDESYDMSSIAPEEFKCFRSVMKR